mgnify:CR=1 FL=1
MLSVEEAKNVFLDFSIVLNSDIEALKKEFDLLIASGKLLYLWSNDYTPGDIRKWIKEHDLFDYIWNYEPKDSFLYSKVDLIIDPDEKLVEKFKNRGIPGSCVKEIR